MASGVQRRGITHEIQDIASGFCKRLWRFKQIGAFIHAQKANQIA
jgi:hypothetical protein